jgi:hypothetical protein
LEKAAEWLRSQQKSDGGVLAGPAKDKQYAYTEITGYYVKYALRYGLLDEAVRSANYIAELNENGFLSWNGKDDLCYSFDVAICADALMDMWDRSYQEKYYNAAHELMGRLKNMYEALGWVPTMSNAAGQTWDNPSVYYKVPGAHYVKLIPIFERFGMSSEYLHRFTHLQRDDGAFHCNPVTRYVFTHFHCYALDGLEGHRKYQRGAAWAKDNLMPDGRIPAWSSDRSWSMPGANMQAAYHLHRVGLESEANRLRDTVVEDQLGSGALPIRTGGAGETWPTLFMFLYAW